MFKPSATEVTITVTTTPLGQAMALPVHMDFAMSNADDLRIDESGALVILVGGHLNVFAPGVWGFFKTTAL